MPLTREIAARLAAAGELVILQRGVEIETIYINMQGTHWLKNLYYSMLN